MAGVVHRDLKPEDVLFTHNGNARVIDFGLAFCLQSGQQLHELVGSEKYIAPEVWRQNHSFGADVWSLGVVLYAMLYREFPFHHVARFRGEDMIVGAADTASLRLRREAYAWPISCPPEMGLPALSVCYSCLSQLPACLRACLACSGSC